MTYLSECGHHVADTTDFPVLAAKYARSSRRPTQAPKDASPLALLDVAARRLGIETRARRAEPLCRQKELDRLARKAAARHRREAVARWKNAVFPWDLPHPEPTGSARRLLGGAGGGAHG